MECDAVNHPERKNVYLSSVNCRNSTFILVPEAEWRGLASLPPTTTFVYFSNGQSGPIGGLPLARVLKMKRHAVHDNKRIVWRNDLRQCHQGIHRAFVEAKDRPAPLLLPYDIPNAPFSARDYMAAGLRRLNVLIDGHDEETLVGDNPFMAHMFLALFVFKRRRTRKAARAWFVRREVALASQQMARESLPERLVELLGQSGFGALTPGQRWSLPWHQALGVFGVDKPGIRLADGLVSFGLVEFSRYHVPSLMALRLSERIEPSAAADAAIERWLSQQDEDCRDMLTEAISIVEETACPAHKTYQLPPEAAGVTIAQADASRRLPLCQKIMLGLLHRPEKAVRRGWPHMKERLLYRRVMYDCGFSKEQVTADLCDGLSKAHGQSDVYCGKIRAKEDWPREPYSDSGAYAPNCHWMASKGIEKMYRSEKDTHTGCPYALMPPDQLDTALERWGGVSDPVVRREIVGQPRPMLACAREFMYHHGEVPPKPIRFPDQYYRLSFGLSMQRPPPKLATRRNPNLE